MENKSGIETMVSLDLPNEEIDLLQKIAADKKTDVNSIATAIIHEHLSRNKKETDQTFEENGVVLECVKIDLPKKIVDYYRMKAYSQNVPDNTETLIAIDISDHVKAEITGRSPEDWQEFFNLTEAFGSISLRENLLDKISLK